MSRGVWIALGCAAVGIRLAVMASWRARYRDVGSVSDQWIAAHHRGNSSNGRTPDTQRHCER
jgi:hypothetical protein